MYVIVRINLRSGIKDYGKVSMDKLTIKFIKSKQDATPIRDENIANIIKDTFDLLDTFKYIYKVEPLGN